MSTKAQPGTIAFNAIEHLRTLDRATELSTHALAAALGQPAVRFGQYLGPAVHAGLLARRVENGFSFWRLGANADGDAAPRDDDQRLCSVSAQATPSVFAYASERGAAPFSVALSTDGRLTAERHGRVIAEFTDTERRILLHAAGEGIAPC